MQLNWTTLQNDSYLAQLAHNGPDKDDDAEAGRIVAQDGPIFEVVSPSGTHQTRPSGRLSYLVDLGTAPVPAVGDYVELRPPGGPIATVFARRTVFERKEAGDRAEAQVICANVDLALIVTTAPAAAVRDPSDGAQLHDFNVRRVERFIATLDAKVQPVVVINKCDLIDDADRVRAAIEAELPRATVLMVSAIDGTGVGAVAGLVPAGTTAVLVGSSGSGKSTLIRRLTGQEIRTGAIRETDGRGRHTTTGRRTYALPGGGFLIDTPGVREVQLWASGSGGGAGTGAEGIASAFPEIEELAGECRFSDCRHRNEPGCAVREAVRDGRVTHDRYLSYLQLQEERDVTAARAEKRQRLNDRRSARKARMERRSRGS